MSNNSKKILIVDDDTLILDAYKDIIEAAGHEVQVAEDGKEALTAAAAFKPDLIILDILMPVMGGLTFLRKFDPRKHPETKILVLSNSASIDNMHDALNIGATAYMVKTNVKPAHIKDTINKLLAIN